MFYENILSAMCLYAQTGALLECHIIYKSILQSNGKIMQNSHFQHLKILRSILFYIGLKT